MVSLAKSRNRAKNRRSRGSFISIPHEVLHSDAYVTLSPKAVKLLIDLANQLKFKQGYGSANNGDLCAAYSVMETRGWNSKNTLNRARKELELSGFVEVTQKGGRNKPTLYAVTWQAIDEIKNKPWISATSTPSQKWRQSSPVDQARSPPTFLLLTPKLNFVVPRIAPIGQILHTIDPRIALVRVFRTSFLGAVMGHLYRSTMCSTARQWIKTNESLQAAHQFGLSTSRGLSA